MKPDKYKKKHKEYLELQRKQDEIWNQIKNLPLVELEKPYQKGWLIKFELRDDIKRRDDVDIIQQVVDLSFRERYTTKVGEVKLIRAGLRSYRNGRGNLVSLLPHGRTLSVKEYEVLSPQIQKYFYLNTTDERYNKWGHKYYISSLPSFYLKLKTRPNMITHIRLRGGDLQSEYDKINFRLWHSGEFAEFYIGYGGSYPKSYGRVQTRDKIRKFLKGEVEDLYNDRTGKEYDY
jgi:hypothetical protein